MSEYHTFPVNLILNDKPCLVVGGGQVGLKKATGLLASGALVTVISLNFVEGFHKLPADNLTLITKLFEPDDIKTAWLVISATGDEQVDRCIYEECEKQQIWVNSADRLNSCNFILPAKSEKSGIMISVSTFGKSPTFAAWLRDYFDSLLDDQLIELFNILAVARQTLKDRGISTQKANLKSFVYDNIIDLIKNNQYDNARSLIEDYISDIL